jgi:uncharacterized protein (TIGR03089 family)
VQTLSDIAAVAVTAEPTRPLLTYYDDATGERTELSGATLANWLAKTANLIVDGAGLGPGDRALVRLPPHWQSVAVLLGCFSAGLCVTADEPAEIAFCAVQRSGNVTVSERFILGLHPLALPLPADAVPPGWVDFVTEVRGHGDRFVPVSPVGRDTPAGPDATQGEMADQALRRAAELGISPGDRVLVDAGAYPEPLDWLLAPLAVRASIVLCGQLDPAKLADRVAAEHVTWVLR